MKQKTRRRLQNAGVLILICLCLAWVATRFWGFTSSTFTDNAHVERMIVPVNSRVQGFVSEVRFDDFSQVKKGDTLAIIDDAEYVLRLAQARADLDNATKGKDALSTSASTSRNDVAVTDAAITEVKALLDNAEADLRRYEGLLQKGAVTQQQFDAVKTNYNALSAKYLSMTRQRQSSSLVVTEKTARLGQNDAMIEMAQAAVHLAELNLSYTVIIAPCDGYCADKMIKPGQLVQPGQTLVDIVDADDVWVIANYREKQTSKMEVGDSVEVKVDAIPGAVYLGVISEISPATGAAFSGQTRANAVGNFVKVEQRIPVKIRLSASNGAESLARLRAGMNVECKVID
ncbi:MAG: HlyD family secretion protein [Clostridium sp.]|nr:HlyD family secretion protein [Clostridium sp.]